MEEDDLESEEEESENELGMLTCFIHKTTFTLKFLFLCFQDILCLTAFLKNNSSLAEWKMLVTTRVEVATHLS